MEKTGALTRREMSEQFLDSMDLEKERGITIKQHSVRLEYKAQDGQDYILNLIDAPGHVDFTYEVSRSLAACQGALLVVDASQGVEAQTLANAHLAVDGGLEIIPVVNKIDLPGAEPEKAQEQIENVIGIDASHAIRASAKQGIGIDEILEAIVHRIPPPQGDPGGTLRALVFDSWFDQYRGVVILVHVVDGKLEPKMKVRLMASGGTYEVEQLGVFTPKPMPVASLGAGEVGFVVAGIKKVSDVAIGDTLTDDKRPAAEALPGFKEIKPMVFAGLYPVDADQYAELRDALEKLRLNDSSFFYEPETSTALGFGFRCGFLGLLHMDIVQERLEREYNMHLITTAPSVVYEVKLRDGTVEQMSNPARLPDPSLIEEFREPIMACRIFVPQEYVGPVISLCTDKRGTQTNMHYSARHVVISYDLPLNEVVLDFFDRLKSMTRGYGSLDYEFKEYRAADMVRLDILVNGDKVDALSSMVHRSAAQHRGRELVTKLRSLIPRQMFDVAVQAAIGGHIIARENVKALRKNVIAKCYGGDITRKRKLLEKQKAGKKRMKQVGSVEIPQEAFLAVLKIGDE